MIGLRWRLAAVVCMSAGLCAAQPAVDLDGAASFDEAVDRVAKARGGSGLGDETRGLVCAALISRGLCDSETAATLLADAQSPGGLYIKAALLAPRDPAAAQDVLERAADSGHAQAQADLGALLLDDGQVEEAERWLRQSLNQSNPAAMHILGMAYLVGDVLEQDEYEGSFLIETAADAGHPEAIYELGAMYLNGIGVGKDPDKAAAYLKQAGDLGMPDGYYLAAVAHLSGIPDPYRNYEAAIAMAEAAAEGGHVYAMILMGDLLSMRTRPFADQARAKGFYRQAMAGSVAKAAQIARERLETVDAPSLADRLRGTGEGYALDNTQKGLLIAGGALLLFGLLNDTGGPAIADPYSSHMDSPGMKTLNHWSTEGMMAGP